MPLLQHTRVKADSQAARIRRRNNYSRQADTELILCDNYRGELQLQQLDIAFIQRNLALSESGQTSQCQKQDYG